MAPEKIDNFVPENFQGFLSHYLGVFVPGTSVPLFGRILPTGKFLEIFVPLYCQRWRPKKLTILYQKTFRDFCSTIWAYLCQGLLSHYLDVYKIFVPLWFQENFQRFCVPLYCQRWRPKKLTILYQKTFRDFCPTIWAYLCQGLLSHYLDVYR